MTKYLVILSKDVYSDNTAAQTAITDSGATIVKSIGVSHAFEIEATEAQLASIAGVEASASSDTVVSAKSEVAHSTDHLKALVDINMVTEYNPMYSGSGIHVYLVDTGINTGHDEFASATVNNLYSNFATDETISDFDDEANHGTLVASLIVGSNIGVVPDATVHNVKLFNDNSSTVSVGEIISAFDAVISHHESTNPGAVKVACMPWTIDQNDFVDAKITEMTAKGIVVVAAAGNDGVDVNTKSPAGVDNIITAGVYNRQFHITSYTNLPTGDSSATALNNYGNQVDIFALANDITVVNPNTTNDYAVVSGTSLAAGIVAGTAAQIIQRSPSASSTEVKIALLSEGAPLGESLLGPDGETGIDYNSVNMSIATSDLAGHPSFAGVQSGRIAVVQNNSTSTVDLQISPSASDVQVLDFAPTPDWISFDASTGIVSINPAFVDSNMVPGAFLFAIKGTINGEVHVEEYSVGVYETDEAELEGDAVASYYYDADLGEYDAVVNYQVAPMIKA